MNKLIISMAGTFGLIALTGVGAMQIVSNADNAMFMSKGDAFQYQQDLATACKERFAEHIQEKQNMAQHVDTNENSIFELMKNPAIQKIADIKHPLCTEAKVITVANAALVLEYDQK